MGFVGALRQFIAFLVISSILEKEWKCSTILHVHAFKYPTHKVSSRNIDRVCVKNSNFNSSTKSTDEQHQTENVTPIVRSRFLTDCINRGIISQVTDIVKLDGLLCESSKREFGQDPIYPAVYYGIDCTNNFIHEGTLLQLLFLRRFLSRKLNVVIVIGGGTTIVGDPSYKHRKDKNKVKDALEKSESVILNGLWHNPKAEGDNEKEIQGAIHKILSLPLAIDGKQVIPNIVNSSDANIDAILKSPYNVIIFNNRDLYENVCLMEYLEVVAKNMNLGRMLSRDSIKLRMSNESDITRKRPFSGVNMDLSELMYMSLQAVDFVHVASKFNVKVQLGGSDQMGNIVSGIELADSLGIRDVIGITTPLLQDKHGEKISKSNSNCLLKITNDTAPSILWTHFRNIDDEFVSSYLTLLTEVPTAKIKETMNEHINNAKILLADELSAELYGKYSVDAIHKYGLSKDFQSLQPYFNGATDIPNEEYDLFSSFSRCVPHARVNEDQLKQGIEFHELLGTVRTPSLASGIFYTNKQSIRDGICKVNGRLETNTRYKITCEDIKSIKSQDGRILSYIILQVGKRQVYFILTDK